MTLQELMTRWNGYQIEMRRWFHQHPEESTKEVKTAERIRAELDRAGIEWRPCGLGILTGVYVSTKAVHRKNKTLIPQIQKDRLP